MNFKKCCAPSKEKNSFTLFNSIKIDSASFFFLEIATMNFMKNFAKKMTLTKHEVKMGRKMERVSQKRVRDKQMRIDRHLKALWSV
jgi:hypothetical protein